MITATLLDVIVKGENVVLKVRFNEDATVLQIKDFVWDMSKLDDLPLSEVRRVITDYKNSVSLKLSKIEILKSHIGEVI